MHVRLEYEEVLEDKKQFLSSQLNLLEILKKVKNYKILRKRELILKSQLKKAFSLLSLEINHIQGFFPREETEESISIRKIIEKEKDKSIEKDLQDIREKLARLS